MLTQAQLQAVEDVEFRLLLDGLFYCHGLDFRDYAPEPLKQRIWGRVREEGVDTLSAYQDRVLHDPAALEQLIAALAPGPGGLFHEPAFFTGFRTVVAPRLRTYPSVKMWLPACGSGEDAFSLAILLHEEGLLPRCRIYATDVGDSVVRPASHGLLAAARVAAGDRAYRAAGGTQSLEAYFTVTPAGEHAALAPSLRQALVFSAHSLAIDDVFNEFEVIVCRDAMRMFNPWLQQRAMSLFQKSLTRFGFLCVGGGEPREVPPDQWYEACADAVGIYRKKA